MDHMKLLILLIFIIFTLILCWKIHRYLFIFVVLLLIWSWNNTLYVGREWYRVEYLNLELNDLPQELSGLKIVQLSDIHFDVLPNYFISEDFFSRVVNQTNSLDPDLILLTGDYIVYHQHGIYPLVPHLKRLRAKHGIIAVMGNHDLYQNGARLTVTNALESAGIRVLDNESMYPFGDGLAIVGIDELEKGNFNPIKAFHGVRSDRPRIVMCHNPDASERMREYRVDLHLSGHTHGGQVRLPIFGAVLAWVDWISKFIPRSILFKIPYFGHTGAIKNWEWTTGLYKITRVRSASDTSGPDHNLLYVNRGIATHPPIRLFCDPEITLITLTSSK